MKLSQARLLVDDFGPAFRSYRNELGLESGFGDVDDAAALAERSGTHAVAGPVDRPDWGGRVAYLRDPSGNLLELFEPIPMEGA